MTATPPVTPLTSAHLPGTFSNLLDAVFRFRFSIHVVIYSLAFWAPWSTVLNRALNLPEATSSTWLELAAWPARNQWMSFTSATVAWLLLGIFLASAGAFLRTWGTAYLGAGIVFDPAMHSQRMLADGPYRHLRNPLYLGTMLHTGALALLMSPSGAIFVTLLIPTLQLMLVAAEERFLTRVRGAEYLAYRQQVPSLLPTIRPAVGAAGVQPHWVQAVVGETYMIGVALSFAVAGWRYNAALLTRCTIVAFGLSLIARALSAKKA